MSSTIAANTRRRVTTPTAPARGISDTATAAPNCTDTQPPSTSPTGPSAPQREPFGVAPSGAAGAPATSGCATAASGCTSAAAAASAPVAARSVRETFTPEPFPFTATPHSSIGWTAPSKVVHHVMIVAPFYG